MTATSDAEWLTRALQLARQAETQGEVPVGAVLVKADRVIGEGWNCPIGTRDPTAHAEIRALRQAAVAEQNYRLPGTTLYVTLEPCVMCAGAIIHARVQRVVFAALDPKAGAAGSVFDILGTQRLNHKVEVCGGVMAEAASELLRSFFAKRRKRASAVEVGYGNAIAN